MAHKLVVSSLLFFPLFPRLFGFFSTLNCLDEATFQLDILALRPGLARLTNLVIEDKISGQQYKMDQPVEVFVKTQSCGYAPLYPVH